MTDKEIEEYIDSYIDMGLFVRPDEARPYLIDGFHHGYKTALDLFQNGVQKLCLHTMAYPRDGSSPICTQCGFTSNG